MDLIVQAFCKKKLLFLLCGRTMLSNMAKSADVLVKRVAVNGTRTHCRLIVIDGLRGIEEQRGYLLTVRHAQSHKGINACFRGERVREGSSIWASGMSKAFSSSTKPGYSSMNARSKRV